MKKFICFSRILFIVLNAVSGVYYLYMGQWKARVSLFGMVSLLLVFIMTADFIISYVKRRNSFFSVILISVFCVMQFFPMIEAFMLNGIFLRNAIFHIIVLLAGTAVLALIRYKAIRTEGEK